MTANATYASRYVLHDGGETRRATKERPNAARIHPKKGVIFFGGGISTEPTAGTFTVSETQIDPSLVKWAVVRIKPANDVLSPEMLSMTSPTSETNVASNRSNFGLIGLLAIAIVLLIFGMGASLTGNLDWGITFPIGATLLLLISIFAGRKSEG